VEVSVLSRLDVTLTHVALLLVCGCSQALGQETQSPPPKKIWTNDDLKQLSQQGALETGKPGSGENSSDADKNEPYRREKDPKWYFLQLEPLLQELTKVENNLRALSEAKRSGKAGTRTIELDNEAAGVTTDGEITVLERRRDDLRKRIDDLEEQGRHNNILPGQMRENAETRRWSPESGESNSFGRESQSESGVAKELESRLTEDKKRLNDVDKELDLLRREQRLEEHKEFSKPEAQPRREAPARLVRIGNEIVEKDTEVQGLQEGIVRLEDQIEDTKRHPPLEAEQGGSLGSSEAIQTAKEEELSWRKQFGEIDYTIAIARKELDILQREHNVLLMQYYANPATAMKEGVTRRDINNHRAAIEGRQKELSELKNQREDLEDALRHAGGPPAWAR
jgi:hypothetical protein